MAQPEPLEPDDPELPDVPLAAVDPLEPDVVDPLVPVALLESLVPLEPELAVEELVLLAEAPSVEPPLPLELAAVAVLAPEDVDAVEPELELVELPAHAASETRARTQGVGRRMGRLVRERAATYLNHRDKRTGSADRARRPSSPSRKPPESLAWSVNARGPAAPVTAFAPGRSNLVSAHDGRRHKEPEMSNENIRSVVNRIVKDVVNGKNLNLIDELYASNYVSHMIPPQMPNGPAGQRQFFSYFFSAFPDFKLTFEDEIVDGNRVAGRGYFTGTHKGEFQGIPATGKQVKVSFMDIWRVEGNRLAEYWGSADMLGLLQQLGAIPAK